MIRRLKRRFVTISTLSLLGVLLVVLSTVNFLFWHDAMDSADSLLTYLAENDGGFDPMDTTGEKTARPGKPEGDGQTPPDKPESAEKSPKVRLQDHEPGFLMTQETSFRTRCFSVIYDPEGNVQSTRTDRIAAVTEDEAVSYAGRAVLRKHDRGMMGIYRYYVERRENETVVVFLDCNDTLANSRTLLFLSGGILLFCLIAMWILLWLLSGKAIRPAVEGMEKQRRFIADAGHELKTPLTIINADAAVLAMTGAGNEWVDSIRNQTHRLDKLVHELLDLSRMEADAPLTIAEFSLSDAAEDTACAFCGVIASRDIPLVIDIQPDIRCRGDEGALRRLVSILMDNAAKYTPEGGDIRFTLKKSGHSIVIETSNTCAPMDKKHLPRLFERFYRVDAARTQTSGGYGIGLSIAREIVHKHHGKITAACPVPTTLTITCSLPA